LVGRCDDAVFTGILQAAVPYLLAFCKRQCRIYWHFASGSAVFTGFLQAAVHWTAACKMPVNFRLQIQLQFTLSPPKHKTIIHIAHCHPIIINIINNVSSIININTQ
jgi:hypothetical protein